MEFEDVKMQGQLHFTEEMAQRFSGMQSRVYAHFLPCQTDDEQVRAAKALRLSHFGT
jgi:hypothetical protein